MMDHKVCALTGHRDLPPDFDRNALYDELEELIREGYDCFLCGMACGFDLTALDCLVELKQKYPIGLEACIPYEGQANGFPAEEKARYDRLLAFCDEKSVLYRGYDRGCFLGRDRYMVDKADLVLAYLTKNTGGTAYTVRYAKKKGVKVQFVGKPHDFC